MAGVCPVGLHVSHTRFPLWLLVQNKQAVLDFSCAHTQQSSEGFTLTLTIFGHAEKKECRTVSNMSVPELAALWSVSFHAHRLKRSSGWSAFESHVSTQQAGTALQ